MKLSKLEVVPDYEIKKWMIRELELTPYQQERMIGREMLRFPFYFYRYAKKEKTSVWWRLTGVFFLIYMIILICFNPVKWLLTGQFGFSQNFMDNFHSKWVRKMGL